MRPLFEKVFIGTGIEPVLNWFPPTALTTGTYILCVHIFYVYIHINILLKLSFEMFQFIRIAMNRWKTLYICIYTETYITYLLYIYITDIYTNIFLSLATREIFSEILSNQTEIRLNLPCTDWFGTANGHRPFAVPNQSDNGEYNLISDWFDKISEKISLARRKLKVWIKHERARIGSVYWSGTRRPTY